MAGGGGEEKGSERARVNKNVCVCVCVCVFVCSYLNKIIQRPGWSKISTHADDAHALKAGRRHISELCYNIVLANEKIM